MKAVVAAFNQEKALVGAFSVIEQPVVEPMDRFAALEEMPELDRWCSLSRKYEISCPNNWTILGQLMAQRKEISAANC